MIVCHWPSRLMVFRPSVLAIKPGCCALTIVTAARKPIQRAANTVERTIRVRHLEHHMTSPHKMETREQQGAPETKLVPQRTTSHRERSPEYRSAASQAAGRPNLRMLNFRDGKNAVSF